MRALILLGRLFSGKPGGETLSELQRSLRPAFERALGGSAGSLALQELIAEQVGAGSVQPVSAARGEKYALTEAGRVQAQRAFPHSAGKSWPVLAKSELTAYALGIHERVSAAQALALSRVPSLRLAIVAQHLKLDVPVVPALQQFDKALIWSLLRQGINDRVYAWGKGQNPSAGAIAAALVASVTDVNPSAKKQEVYARCAANLVQANSAKDLHAALLARLVGTDSGTQAGASKQQSPKQEAPKQQEPLQTFANKVLAAARSSESGKLDASLILINHAYDRFAQRHPSEVQSLEAFKEQLWSCAVGGLLKLASADMPQVLDARDYAQSRIERGASIFSLIRI